MHWAIRIGVRGIRIVTVHSNIAMTIHLALGTEEVGKELHYKWQSRILLLNTHLPLYLWCYLLRQIPCRSVSWNSVTKACKYSNLPRSSGPVLRSMRAWLVNMSTHIHSSVRHVLLPLLYPIPRGHGTLRDLFAFGINCGTPATPRFRVKCLGTGDKSLF